MVIHWKLGNNRSVAAHSTDIRSWKVESSTIWGKLAKCYTLTNTIVVDVVEAFTTRAVVVSNRVLTFGRCYITRVGTSLAFVYIFTLILRSFVITFFAVTHIRAISACTSRITRTFVATFIDI